VERRGRAKSAGDEWMRRAEARAATTAAQGRARASRETTAATTAALDGVVVSSTMASMADGEVRHDLLLLDTLRRRTNKIRRRNRRGRCPRRRSTWVISPGAR